MRFTRFHGLGNDYLVLDDGPALTAELVVDLCDRHRGIGGDGILEPTDAIGADHGVRIWNPDGSIAEKSGNGLRIFARWLADEHDAGERFSVWTGHETVQCTVCEQSVTVHMGRARFAPEDVPVVSGSPVIDTPFDVGDTVLPVTAVGVGNPHCVIFRTGNLDALPWRTWGPSIERHRRFPNRTNVQFARVLERDHVEIRIWERGAGETQASGSSACAVAAAGVQTDRLDPGAILVTMPGGELEVTVELDFGVLLEGPVERIGRFEVDEGWLLARGARG